MPRNTSYTYHSATEPIQYTFLNDYMFHIVFQDTHILEGFLCALLRLKPEQIHSITVTNPIDPGKTINAKTFILDIRIVLNSRFQINLELQVVNRGNWPEHSLNYLCRSFDSLYKGEDYGKSDTAIHISILDFTLFPECPEFYAIHKLMNVKNHPIFIDKFQLNVLDLNHTELATAEDKAYGLDRWAALFKSATWKEIKMLAEKDPYIDDAAQKLYEACADLWVQDNCRAREEYLRTYERLDQLTAEKAALQDKNAALQDKLARLQAKLAQYESEQ